MKLRNLLTLLILFAFDLNAQEAKIAESGVYLSSNDYLNNTPARSFSKGEGLRLLESRSTILIKAADTTYKFYNDDIWGYRKSGTDWRVYNEEFYRIDYTGKIILYTLPGCSVCSNFQTVYFSTNLNSPLRELTKRNLKEAYQKNTDFIQKLNKLPVTSSIEKRDKRSGRYLFLDWL